MFREKYLDYAELTACLAAWTKQYPDIARVTTIGKSAEGRDIPLLTIGRNPDEARPADLGRRQHARVGALRLERRARHRRGHHRAAQRRAGMSAARRLPAHMVDALTRCALLRRPAHLARRRRGSADQGPLRPLEPGRRPHATRATRTGRAPTSTATACRLHAQAG